MHPIHEHQIYELQVEIEQHKLTIKSLREDCESLSAANEFLYEEIDGMADVIRHLENQNEALKAQNAILKERLDNSIPTPTKFLDFVYGNK